MIENAGKLFLEQPCRSSVAYSLKVGVENRIGASARAAAAVSRSSIRAWSSSASSSSSSDETLPYQLGSRATCIRSVPSPALPTAFLEHRRPVACIQKNVYVAIGAKDDTSLIFADRLIELIPNTLCTTDDGSVGKKCYVTDTIEDIIKEKEIDLILTCGPEVMMKKVLDIADSHEISIQASLERKMKCGVGLCGSCCVGKDNNITVYKEGPVFDSEKLKTFPQFGNYIKK